MEPQKIPAPSNPGFPLKEVFDDKKASHKEVATFVQNSLGPIHNQMRQFNAVLDALFLYLAEVGVMGVKITQKEIAEHYGKRLKEESEKQQKAQAQTPCSSEPIPDSSLTSMDSSEKDTSVTTT